MEGTDKRTLTFIYQSFVKNILENLSKSYAVDMDAIVAYANEKMRHYLTGEAEKNKFIAAQELGERTTMEDMEQKAMAMKYFVFYRNEIDRIESTIQIPAYELFTALVQYPEGLTKYLMQVHKKQIEFYQTQQCRNT